MEQESILGVIPNVHSGLLGQKAYNLVVTRAGIIVAQLTSDMIKEEAGRASREAKEEGKGFLKRTLATMSAGMTLYQRYFTMAPAAILAENQGNFMIPVEHIKSLKIKKGRMDDQSRQQSDELRIKWSGGKNTYSFTSISAREAKELLGRMYPGVK
ncbi:MAG TPA: hypothetical protein ENN54_02850 [Thermoplasmatales archaeon]|nr:hypothetical protein [Thermoplasmatales archaeon]